MCQPLGDPSRPRLDSSLPRNAISVFRISSLLVRGAAGDCPGFGKWDLPASIGLRAVQSDAMVEEIRRAGADIVLLQEYSARWHAELGESGVLAPYPHRVSRVRNDSFGTAIYSKLPFVAAEIVDLEGQPMSTARVAFARREVDILNVHTLPPRLSAYLPTWRAQTAWLRERARRAEDPLIMVGDFNATQHSRAYAELLQAGLVDSHREVGRGYATTFPNGLAPVPPIRIDHVFHTSQLKCVSLSEGVGAGSDHRPLSVRLTWH